MSREDNPPWLFIAIVTKFKFLNLALSDEALQGFRPCLLTQPLLLPPALSSGLKPHDLLFSNSEKPLGLARTISATPPTSFESLLLILQVWVQASLLWEAFCGGCCAAPHSIPFRTKVFVPQLPGARASAVLRLCPSMGQPMDSDWSM